MPPEDDPILAAHTELEAVRQLLLKPSPEAMDQCAPRLENAIARVKALESLRNPKLIPGLCSLRRAVARAAALLESCGAFYSGWSYAAAVQACGYMRNGEPAGLERRGNLSVEG